MVGEIELLLKINRTSILWSATCHPLRPSLQWSFPDSFLWNITLNALLQNSCQAMPFRLDESGVLSQGLPLDWALASPMVENGMRTRAGLLP